MIYEDLPEDLMNRDNASIYQRIDALIRSYEEAIRQSVHDRNDRLNFLARTLLNDLRNHKRDLKRDLEMLEVLFESFDEQLFRLCLNEDGTGFVRVEYLPPSVLV